MTTGFSQDVEVIFRRDLERWQQLPEEIRSALERGANDVATIRDDIRRDAKVHVMPVVEMFDQIWYAPDGRATVDGRASFSFGEDGSKYPAALLAAPVLCCGDDEVIRATLVHEFTHCFYMISVIVERIDDGVATWGMPQPPPGIFADLASDKATMVDPSLWFSKEDAERFVHWNDPRMYVIHYCMIELKLHHHLPQLVPDLRFRVDSLHIHEDVIAHVRKLRSERGYPLFPTTSQ
jgi:hypothetical protein